MSALPKLPTRTREELRQVVERRRLLTKMIATLQDEKRQLQSERDQLPTSLALAKKLNVSRKVINRVIYGEPYRMSHPEDDQALT